MELRRGDDLEFLIPKLEGAYRYRLRCTCLMYPEQYDIFHNGKQVGFLHLRHGSYTAKYPDNEGEEILKIDDQSLGGGFTIENRDEYLRKGVEAIHDQYRAVESKANSLGGNLI